MATKERKHKISRRRFLTGTGGLMAGLAAIGLGGAHSASLAQPGAPWSCPCCGEEFDTPEALQEHIAAEHERKLPEIRRVNQPTYSHFLVGPIERFDQKNIVFSRAMWDEEYKAQLRSVTRRMASQAMELQALEGRALVAGAIYVDNTAGSLHPQYSGYGGHVRDVGGLYGWDDPVNSTQLVISDPAYMSKQVKRVAKFYGADLVGICEVDQRWVYSHYFERTNGDYGELELPYKYAIVLGIRMDQELIERSPRFEASAATALAYSQMAEVAASLAKYIRALGYPAVPSGNDTAQSIPLAIDAGLGELGRCGLLVSPQFGPRQRLCKVFTDLPLAPDQPIDFGLRSFCPTCGICAWRCPAGAIRHGDRTTEPTSISNRTGILRWPVDVAKCYLFWQENGCDCSNCVKACPWGWSIRLWL
jgi:NAD-dependent dihydropyrimidine dehydrogenase PreA subunit